MRKEYLTAINEFSSFSENLRDFKIHIRYLEQQNDCDAVLSKKFFVAKEDKQWSLQFKLINPRIQESPAGTVEDMGRSVLENPKLMTLILNRLDCFDIERLRKVNRQVRKCIDEVEPDPHIETFSITFDLLSAVNLPETRVGLESGDFKKISYGTKEGTSLCLNDFETTLKHQKSCMEQLSIIFTFTNFECLESSANLCKKIEEVLKRREQPLKTRKFSMAYG